MHLILFLSILQPYRYLASGNEFTSFESSWRMNKCTIAKIVHETCSVIWDVLQPEVLVAPSTPQEWYEIAHQFETLWNFPNCVGAIDGKHVVVQKPKLCGSEYFNYKKTHSIVLMATCDARYKFTMVDIGSSGRNSDGGVFMNSAFGEALNAGKIDLPPPRNINGESLPYVFVGDEAFPLKGFMMRPFPGRLVEEAKQIFNYQL